MTGSKSRRGGLFKEALGHAHSIHPLSKCFDPEDTREEDTGPFPPGVTIRYPLARKHAKFTWSHVS